MKTTTTDFSHSIEDIRIIIHTIYKIIIQMILKKNQYFASAQTSKPLNSLLYTLSSSIDPL